MKRTTFNIRQTTGKLLQRQGYTFRLPYPKRALFAIAKEGNVINSSKRWVVTEMTSGLAVAFGKWDGTRKDAITRAKVNLRRYGARNMKCYAKESIAEHGGTAN